METHVWFGIRGRHFLKALLASTALGCVSGFCTPIHAADWPVKAGALQPPESAQVWSWTGFYVGAHAGGAFGSSDWRSATGALANFSDVGFPGKGNGEGLLGGGQVGVNYQLGSWVTGLEIAAAAADVDGYAPCARHSELRNVSGKDQIVQMSYTCHDRITSIGTISGRLGHTFGNLLVYGKAGAAWATEANDARIWQDPYSNWYRQSGTRWGWMGGAGLEYAFSPNLSAFVEYNHLDFGSRDSSFVDQFSQVSTVGIRQQMDLVKMGVNYRLGSAGAIQNVSADSVPALPGGWTMEVGSRYFGSTGRMQKDLYDPSRTTQLNSRLIYGDQTGHAAETFFRFDHKSGLFVKGNLGIGQLVDGKLHDEDFPGSDAKSVSYSNTVSRMNSGRFTYGAADAGYNFINDDGRRLGVFAGYRSF